MATDSTLDRPSRRDGWTDATAALLVGVAVFGAMVMHVATIQPPGLAPPVGIIPLFVFTTTAAAMGFVLLNRGHGAGYAVAILAGLLAVATIALVASGTVGPLKPGTNPAGPGLYGLLGLATIVSSLRAWRARSTTAGTPDAAATAE